MILRKVSNLRPKDGVLIYSSVLEVIEIVPSPVLVSTITIHFANAPSRVFLSDDYVEIVIL